MTGISLILTRVLLGKVLGKPCPDVMPPPSWEGVAWDCFYIHVEDADGPFLWVKEINKDGLTGVGFSNNTPYAASAPFALIRSRDIRITHHHGLARIVYHGLWDYLINGFTGKTRFTLFVGRIYRASAQYVFNRRNLVLFQRMELLKLLIDRSIQTGGKGIDALDLMTELYTTKWALHPKGENLESKLQLYLESFVDTGELTEHDLQFVVTSKAIATLSNYEEEERRHRDNTKIQRRMVYVTTAIGLLMAVQAGLMPILLDLGAEIGRILSP